MLTTGKEPQKLANQCIVGMRKLQELGLDHVVVITKGSGVESGGTTSASLPA